MNDEAAARDALVNRQLPEMVLSNGAADSMTPPTQPFPDTMVPAERTAKRFEVRGNAIVTGGTGTLATQGAQALLEHGVSGLALCDVNPAAGENTAAALRKQFPHVKILLKQLDVRKEDEIAAVFEQISKELGGIDVLVNFAGVVGCTPALEQEAGDWRRLIEINTTGSFLVSQAAARHMKAQGRGGSIVLIASMSCHIVNFPQPQAAYNVSKAAVIHLCRSMAAELAVHGIRVNSISPGYMDTVLNHGPGLEAAKKHWYMRCPMGRMGSPPELTGPLILLASHWAGAYITAADLVVDGGTTALS